MWILPKNHPLYSVYAPDLCEVLKEESLGDNVKHICFLDLSTLTTKERAKKLSSELMAGYLDWCVRNYEYISEGIWCHPRERWQEFTGEKLLQLYFKEQNIIIE